MSELVSEKNKENMLPMGWRWAKIEDITDVIRGASPRPKGDPKYFGGNIPWIMIRDISREKGKFITQTKDHVTEAGAKKSRLLEKGSLILSNSGTVCVPKILGVDGCIHDGFVAFPMLIENIEILYAFYWFEYIRSKIIQENKQGITQVNLNTSIVKNIDIPIPPLNEQKRIVTKIEELFSLLESTKEILEKTKILLKQYRSSILKSAFEGKLVPQVPNDEPASMLLEKIRWEQSNNQLMSKLVLENNNELPIGWEWVKLSEIAIINPTKPHNVSDDLDVSFIPMKCVEELTGKIDLNNIKKYNDVKKGFTSFLDDDIIFAKITPCMENGKIAIVKNLKNGIGFGSTEFHVIRMKNRDISEKLYFLYFVQDDFRNKAQRNMKGTAGQLRVPTDYLKELIIPLPPLKEQKRIVAKIEESFSLIHNSEKLVDSLLLQSNYMKNSILKQAFEGNLVPQDPNDEPAEILLEKIKQEKQKIISQTKRGKK